MQQPLREPMFTHHRDCQVTPLVGELQVPVTLDVQQSIPLHPCDGLTHRRSGLTQPLGNSRAQWDDALFLELVDRPQIHLCGVDQIAVMVGIHARPLPQRIRRDDARACDHVRTVRMTVSATSALVGVSALANRLGTPTPPVLLDVRWVVGSPALRNAYLAAHIPGARFCDLDRDLADPPGFGGRHPLPDPARLQTRMRDWGIDDTSAVVVYDSDTSVAAARAWWVLRWAGLSDVKVLDGGFAAWSSSDQPIEAGEEPPAGSGTVTVRPGSIPSIGDAEAAKLGAAGRLIDVRAPERYRGEVEPMDPVAGHIPGARNLPTTDNTTSAGTFKPPALLKARFAEAGLAGDAEVGVYCGSGVTAAHTVLAMQEAGISAVLYPGSWSHWITDPQRPVSTGNDR
jgi:thiosulfate/3-mercaptopyruvate sulfurtransferase